ncbi:uncharacterized protein LOC144151567 [Haemaphysalis longicornis]
MRSVLLLFILGLSHGQRQPKLQDLYESLDTPRRIWLMLQTYPAEIHGRQVTCISYKKTDLTMKNYYFKRFYRHLKSETRFSFVWPDIDHIQTPSNGTRKELHAYILVSRRTLCNFRNPALW